MRANSVRRDPVFLFEADGSTPLSGVAAADVAVFLALNGEAIAASIVADDGRDDVDVVEGELLFQESGDAPGTYFVRWRVGNPGNWLLHLDFDTDPPQPQYALVDDATAADLDDVAAAVANIVGGVVIGVTGVDGLRAGEAWNPIVRVFQKSTMSAVDLVPLVSLTVLSADGLDELETVDGADVERLALGVYTHEMSAVDTAGSVFLRIRYRLDGGASAADDPVEVRAIPILPALEAGEAAEGVDSQLEHIYTCPTYLEEAGFDLAGLSTLAVWNLIEQVARQIDDLTGQWFNADLADWDWDGRGSALATSSNDIPIVWVESVTALLDRVERSSWWTYEQCPIPAESGSYEYPALEYTPRGRVLQRIRREWPKGPRCLRVRAGLGWVEHPGLYETTSTSAVGPNSASVVVSDISGFRRGAVVDIIGEADSIRVICTAVNRLQRRVHFDVRGKPADEIAEGAVVRTGGHVPGGIRDVANFLFGAVRREHLANAQGAVPRDLGAIKREQTDGYEIEFFNTNPSSDSGGMSTGSPKYDAILRMYCAPARIRVV